MPRHSRRQRAIAVAKSKYQKACRMYVLGDSSDEESSGSDMESFVVASHLELRQLESARYVFRGKYRSHRKAVQRYEDDLADENDVNIPWLKEEEFLEKYRMSRDAFAELLDLIKDDIAFKNRDPNGRGRRQRPVEYQLMTTLKALGSEGNAFSAPGLRNVFATGKGTSNILLIVYKYFRPLKSGASS
eukprot:scaffold11850_cov102-Amphora_coffeaeformis.AAC.1